MSNPSTSDALVYKVARALAARDNGHQLCELPLDVQRLHLDNAKTAIAVLQDGKQ